MNANVPIDMRTRQTDSEANFRWLDWVIPNTEQIDSSVTRSGRIYAEFTEITGEIYPKIEPE